MFNPNEVTFHNADGEVVPYDGSSIAWRVSAYVVLKNDQQEVLLIKGSHEMLCDIPGGGIEFGETIAQTVKREALEEAGVTGVELGQLIHLAEDFFYHREHKPFLQTLQLFYAGKVTGELGKPLDERTEWIKWVPLSEVSQYDLPAAVKTAISL